MYQTLLDTQYTLAVVWHECLGLRLELSEIAVILLQGFVQSHRYSDAQNASIALDMTADDEGDFRSEVNRETKAYFSWLLFSLLDAGFVVIWVLLQWLVSRVLGLFTLEGIDAVVLKVFQVVFAASTLVPIFYHIAQTMIVAGARLIVLTSRQWYGVRAEIRKTRSNGQD